MPYLCCLYLLLYRVAVSCPVRTIIIMLLVYRCCFPIASASTAAPRLYPLQLLLPDYSCCSPIVSASAAASRFSCVCLPIVSAPASAPVLCPLQLLLPYCVRFSFCSRIVSASAAAPLLCLLQHAASQLHPLQLLLPNGVPPSLSAQCSRALEVQRVPRITSLVPPDLIHCQHRNCESSWLKLSSIFHFGTGLAD